MGIIGSSRRLAIAASLAALFVFIWGVLLDWHYVLGEWEFTVGQMGIAALIYTALIAGWIWALIGAQTGSKGALYALLAYAMLLFAYALQDLLVYCPSMCPNIWLYYIANWGNLVLSVVAGAAIVMGLKSPSKS